MDRKSIICAIVKNEQRFIREWVEYYIAIGFKKIYIFEDYGSDIHEDEVSDYIGQNKVELISLQKTKYIPKCKKGTQVQHELYKKFLERCKAEKLADWVGFFDVDEFIMFEDGWDLNSLEDEFDDCGGVLLSWKIYGANGHIKRPEGKVVDSYTTHMEEGIRLDKSSIQWNIKSLVNVKNCKGMRNIHIFEDCQFTDHKKFSLDGKMSFCKAWLNHYYTKSWEDYVDRIFARGNMQNNYRSLDQFFYVNQDLYPKMEEIIQGERNKHTASTMYVSRNLNIISGGNIERLNEIKNKIDNARKI